MNIKILFVAVVMALAFAGSALAHCGTCGVGEPKAAQGATTTEGDALASHLMENKTCCCGAKLSEEAGKTHHVEYNGKTYHFCSLECAEAFKKNPEEMAKKITEEPAK